MAAEILGIKSDLIHDSCHNGFHYVVQSTARAVGKHEEAASAI